MSPKRTNIVLIGLMGAGKSTVGRDLAELLGYGFIDLDDELEKRTGVSIPVIFDVEGEEGFRIREAKLIEDLIGSHEMIISTGGGCVLLEQNRENLKALGVVVYLLANVDLLYQRVSQSKNRPLLNNKKDMRNTLQNLLDQRDSLYRETADMIVECNHSSPKDMARRIKSAVDIGSLDK